MKGLCLAALIVLVNSTAHAQLHMLGDGENLRVDTAGFTPQMRKAYRVMMQKCTQCHTAERIMIAVNTGVTPITHGEFTKNTTTDVVTRMYLKPTANLTRKEAREIILLLNYMLDSK